MEKLSNERTHTEVLFDLIERWQSGKISNQVLIRDLSGMAANTDYLEADKAALEQRVESYEDALDRIVQWSKAYPLEVFPEPDFKQAAQLLEAGGMTLDAISASNMRHVVEGVGEIAREALAAEEDHNANNQAA